MAAVGNKKPRLTKGEVFLTYKEKALSGSIRPLRGNEEAERRPLAFEISVAGHVPSFQSPFGRIPQQFTP
jgi:hypothetical protein